LRPHPKYDIIIQIVLDQIAVTGIFPQNATNEKFLAIKVYTVVIVSSDKHLLNLDKFKNIPILKPPEFLDRPEQETHE